MIRVVTFLGASSARDSRAFSSSSIFSGAMTSGSYLTWKEALAGQISVTPARFFSRRAPVIEIALKKASRDISSSTSTKICSSPPKE